MATATEYGERVARHWAHRPVDEAGNERVELTAHCLNCGTVLACDKSRASGFCRVCWEDLNPETRQKMIAAEAQRKADTTPRKTTRNACPMGAKHCNPDEEVCQACLMPRCNDHV